MKRYKIVGSSMVPFLKPGMEVEIKCVDIINIHIGDIIVFYFPSLKKFYIHRVVKKRKGNLLTKGDCNWRKDKLCLKTNKIFRVTTVYDRNRIIHLDSPKYKCVNYLFYFLSILRIFPIIRGVPIKQRERLAN